MGYFKMLGEAIGRDLDGLDGVLNEFHTIYYDGVEHTWGGNSWLGVPIRKYPSDMLAYSEIIYETRPSYIIETGTQLGGSALFMATICDLVNVGRVISIDVEKVLVPKHPRITYIVGDSLSSDVIDKVESLIEPPIMVVLDSNHTKEHVEREISTYSKYVSPGRYLIVEDTNLGGNPVLPEWGPGPMEAVKSLLMGNKDWSWDAFRERNLLTANPYGYWRKNDHPSLF